MELSLALPLLGLLAIMWASERRKNRTLVYQSGAIWSIFSEMYEQESRSINLTESIESILSELRRLELSVEQIDFRITGEWVSELAKNDRVPGTRPYESRTAGPKAHDPRNELSAVRDEADAELGILQDTSTAYQMKPDAEPQHTTPRENCLACKEIEARDVPRQLDEQSQAHAIEYGLPRPDAGFRWERQKDGAYLKVRMYGAADQFPPEQALTYGPGLWRHPDGTQLSPEESAQLDADVERMFGTGDNRIIQ